MNISEKKNLERCKFRELRDRNSLNDRRAVENNVKKFVDLFFKQNKKIDYIGIYWPLKNEIDLRSLKSDFHLALPRCEKDKRISFYPWDDRELTKDEEGILSPYNSYSLSFQQISLIFIPCLSVDKSLIRLGYGGGYFDKLRAIENWRKIPCIGLLNSNCVSKIPLTKAHWDIPLSGFITEKEILV